MTPKIVVETTRDAYRVKIPEHCWPAFVDFMRESRSPCTLTHHDLNASVPKALGRGPVREVLEHFFDGIEEVCFE